MSFKNVKVINVTNHGPVGSDILGFYTDFESGGHPRADNSRGYGGTTSRGASFIFADADIDLEISGIRSINGRAYPVDIREECSLDFKKLDVES